MSEKVKNGLKTAIEYVKTYGCGCDHEVGFMCAECCLSRAISDGLNEIQSLEQEVAMLKEENLKLKLLEEKEIKFKEYLDTKVNLNIEEHLVISKMKNCVNCKHFSMGVMCLHPNHPATLNYRCNLWEIKK